jgi:hypothetical protein
LVFEDHGLFLVFSQVSKEVAVLYEAVLYSGPGPELLVQYFTARAVELGLGAI